MAINKDILVLGDGFIGHRLKEELGCGLCATHINSFDDAENVIKRRRPKIIINCIGYTGRNVDDCESAKEKTLFLNTSLPFILAEVALRHNIRFVHISSGCIYHYDESGDKPIREERVPDFFDLFYSRTKIYSEQGLLPLAQIYPVLIIRIRIPLDCRPHPKNILTKLIGYKRIIDVPNSVTYIPDFIKALKHLIRIRATGIYNVVNKGPLLYSDLMEIYRKRVHGFTYEVIDFKQLKLVRTNLVLSTHKLKKSGFKMRKINEVLEECVEGYLKY